MLNEWKEKSESACTYHGYVSKYKTEEFYYGIHYALGKEFLVSGRPKRCELCFPSFSVPNEYIIEKGPHHACMECHKDPHDSDENRGAYTRLVVSARHC